MKKIIIYSTPICPYCTRAKMLLKRKEAPFEEIIITDDKSREEMIAKAGGKRTVPQIFIDDKHIGGCDELYALESDGKLDGLLN
ncbi:MAG: glutaredoxin 3 [Rickettsiaceae bacterium]|nr:glutaredoxin 3 [Rickettsiaceae bacterium]